MSLRTTISVEHYDEAFSSVLSVAILG